MESFYALMNNTSPFRYRNFGSDLHLLSMLPLKC